MPVKKKSLPLPLQEKLELQDHFQGVLIKLESSACDVFELANLASQIMEEQKKCRLFKLEDSIG